MTRTITFAFAGLALAASAIGPAAAQPRLEQTGDGYSLIHDGAWSGEAAGGRAGRLVGGGEEAAVLYTGPDTARAGSLATLSGGGDNTTITYGEPASAVGLAGGASGGSARGGAGRG
ncbi:hypothetical protein GCM10009416_10440 [Craurococcus roseus]|uniref:Uncharacterized protein n=1 Tax=Craurococcus roseus TaxID=77585 RepID=A0ABN1EU35_9PROT